MRHSPITPSERFRQWLSFAPHCPPLCRFLIFLIISTLLLSPLHKRPYAATTLINNTKRACRGLFATMRTFANDFLLLTSLERCGHLADEFTSCARKWNILWAVEGGAGATLG